MLKENDITVTFRERMNIDGQNECDNGSLQILKRKKQGYSVDGTDRTNIGRCQIGDCSRRTERQQVLESVMRGAMTAVKTSTHTTRLCVLTRK